MSVRVTSMAGENANIEAQVQDDAVQYVEAATAKERSAWVRRHLSDSVYLWACGETAEKEDDVLALSDRLIGWLVLLIQGLLYAALLYRAGNASSSSSSDTEGDADDGSNSEQRGYRIASLFAAMYLLVATTLPDVRAGFSFSANGVSAAHRVFGAGLLVVYGLMISTAMKVLTSADSEDATVILNAVLVLFVADLDAKAYAFFTTVPKAWRLFWAMFSVWISFVLAVIAVVYAGDSSDALDVLPSWFYLAVSPAAAALCSFAISKRLHNFLESCSQACGGADRVTFGFIVSRGCSGLSATIKRASERFRGDRCFYVVRTLWLAQGVISWWFLFWAIGLPVAFDVPPFQFDEGEDFDKLTLTPNLGTMVFSVAVAVVGFVFKACACLLQKKERSADLLGEPSPSDRPAVGEGCGKCADARVPSLLVGWGVGYWVTSLLYALGGAWHGGGWTNAPIAVTIVGYVVLPCFLAVGVLTKTETKLLGEKPGASIKPVIVALNDKRKVWYWVMATVFRDVFLLWVIFLLVLIIFLATTYNS